MLQFHLSGNHKYTEVVLYKCKEIPSRPKTTMRLCSFQRKLISNDLKKKTVLGENSAEELKSI